MKHQEQGFFQKHFTASSIVIVGLIVGVYAFFVLIPKAKSFYNGNVNDVSAKEVELQTLKTKLLKLGVLKENFESLSDQDREKIESFIPKNRNEALLLAQIEKLAQSSGLVVLGVTMTDQAATAKLKGAAASDLRDAGVMNVKVTVSPVNYASLKSFIISLEDHQRLMDVTSFSVQRKGDTADVEMRVYFQDKK
ncbi:MAG: hypothetical protein HY453_00400 [Parcubacteria group bacterium]|nr:hypothetical protein [Parcubacteria group bacterium]